MMNFSASSPIIHQGISVFYIGMIAAIFGRSSSAGINFRVQEQMADLQRGLLLVPIHQEYSFQPPPF